VRTTLIVNPKASRVTDALVDAVARELNAVAVLRTERGGHATELAAAVETEAVAVFSGDGGFNEVLNGLRPETVAGFIPGGGTSVLPRALGLPRDPVAVARRLAAGDTRRIGLGRVNGRRFAFSAGVGLDAELVRRVDALGRRADGRRAGDVRFTLTALKAIADRRFRFDEVLEVDGFGRAAFALVANGDPYSYVGALPLHVAPDAAFEGGLDVVAPRGFTVRTLPRFATYLLRGHGQQRSPSVYYGHDLDRIVIRCDRPLPLQADGEDLGDVMDVVVEAERDAISVLV
jgi:diacylglycerol kinase family enzyme